jgi:uncharacterized membrane protein
MPWTLSSNLGQVLPLPARRHHRRGHHDNQATGQHLDDSGGRCCQLRGSSVRRAFMTFAKAFAGVLVAFFSIDIVWISRVVRPMYAQEVGVLLRANFQIGAAAVFYLMYAAGIVYFAVLPALPSGGARLALLNGAILGGLSYGTYAFTNYAILKEWTFRLVVADVIWGIVLTAVTAACGLFAARLGS